MTDLLPRGECVQPEEGAARIDEPVDTLARGELPSRPVPFARALAAAARDVRRPLAELRHERLHRLRAPREGLVMRELRGQQSRARSAPTAPARPTVPRTRSKRRLPIGGRYVRLRGVG